MTSRTVLDIVPSKGNSRNSEGDFLRLKDGSILLVYSRFTGDSGQDDEVSEIASYRSFDEGETWTGPKVLFRTSDFEGCRNIMSVSLLRMQDGAVGLFFLLRKHFADTRLHLFRSYDEGETWEKPVLCIPHRGYFVTNNDRVLRTSTGRLLVPGNLHANKAENDKEAEGWGSFTGHALGYFFYSDDDGRTWRETPTFCSLPFSNSQTGLQETGLIEFRPGVIQAYFRTDLGFQYGSVSYDDGLHWTPVEPLFYFTSPNSPMKIERLADGRFMAVWNPVPIYTGRKCRFDNSRTPLSVAFSRDGSSWEGLTDLEDDPESGYCYPAVFSENGYALIAYCAGSPQDGGCLDRLRVRKILFETI